LLCGGDQRSDELKTGLLDVPQQAGFPTTHVA
jgi:hypothetical protein